MRTGSGPRYRFADIEVDVQNLRVMQGGSVRPLEPKSFRLLLLLMENHGRVVSKEEIMASLWPGTFVTDNALTRAIAQIRRALSDDAKEPKFIETVPTVGYRFLGTVAEETGAGATAASADSEKSAPRRANWVAIAAVAAGLVLLSTAGIIWRFAGYGPRYAPMKATRLTYFPGEETNPAFSPDGHSVAFSWSGEPGGGRIICAISVDTHTPRRVTRAPADDLSPAWSPDGKQIAFVRLDTLTSGHLMVIPAEGGTPHAVQPVQIKDDIYRAMGPLLTWMPDGSGIVYTTQSDQSERASLYWTDPGGHTARKLFDADEKSAGATSPALSRNGKWLAYTVVFGPYESQLFVRPVSGKFASGADLGAAVAITNTTTSFVTSPAWAPDGKQLLFTKDSAIFEWDGGGSPKQVYLGADFAGMSAIWGTAQPLRVVTADADQNHAEIRVVPLQPGGMTAAGESAVFAPYAGQSSPGFSPDGKWVVFHSSRSGTEEIWVMGGDGQHARQLTHLKASVIGFPRWSHDGKQIAFHAWVGGKPQIYALDVVRELASDNTGPEQALQRITDSDFGFFSPAWSADGNYLYANSATGGSRMFRIPVRGGQPQELFEGATAMISPDGHRMIYAKIGHPGIFSRALDGDVATNPEERLVEDYRPPGSDLNPVADGVYYISWNGVGKPRAIRFYSYAQRKSFAVVALSARVPDVPGLAISPDRRRLLYSQFTAVEKNLTLIDFR